MPDQEFEGRNGNVVVSGGEKLVDVIIRGANDRQTYIPAAEARRLAYHLLWITDPVRIQPPAQE